MPRRKSTTQKTETEEVQQDNVTISGTVGAETPEKSKSLTGTKITLNQKKASFFGVGDIWLTSDDYTTTVPKNLTDKDAAILQRALDQGLVLEGEDLIDPIDKDPAVLEEYWDLIKQFGLSATDSKSRSMHSFRKVFRNGTDRNWTAKEIATHCIKREQEFKNRKQVLKLLNDILQFSEGPFSLYEKK